MALAKKIVLYLQDKAGSLHEIGSSNIISSSVSVEYGDRISSSIYDVYDDVSDTLPKKVISDIHFIVENIDVLEEIMLPVIKEDKEWRCPFCGHINKNSYRICGEDDPAMGCGHPKTKITDIIY